MRKNEQRLHLLRLMILRHGWSVSNGIFKTGRQWQRQMCHRKVNNKHAAGFIALQQPPWCPWVTLFHSSIHCLQFYSSCIDYTTNFEKWGIYQGRGQSFRKHNRFGSPSVFLLHDQQRLKENCTKHQIIPISFFSYTHTHKPKHTQREDCWCSWWFKFRKGEKSKAPREDLLHLSLECACTQSPRPEHP